MTHQTPPSPPSALPEPANGVGPPRTGHAPLPPEVEAALARATSHIEDRAIEITRTYDGEDFTFRFLPHMPEDAMQVVTRMSGLAELRDNIAIRDDGTADLTDDQIQKLQALLDGLTEFLDCMVVGHTGTLIASLIARHLIDITDLSSIQAELVERVGGRPTTRPSSSVSGSPEGGETSTVSADFGVSTPPAST